MSDFQGQITGQIYIQIYYICIELIKYTEIFKRPEIIKTTLITGQLLKDLKSLLYMFIFSDTLGWRPRRTIVFCSWGAEEYGLIGSTEWVEVTTHDYRKVPLEFTWIDTILMLPMMQYFKCLILLAS